MVDAYSHLLDFGRRLNFPGSGSAPHCMSAVDPPRTTRSVLCGCLVCRARQTEADAFIGRDSARATELHKAQPTVRHHSIQCGLAQSGDLRPFVDAVGEARKRPRLTGWV